MRLPLLTNWGFKMARQYEYVGPDQQQVLDNLAESLMRSRRERFAQLMAPQATAQVFDFPTPRVDAEVAPVIA
jgi:hypothetical protein